MPATRSRTNSRPAEPHPSAWSVGATQFDYINVETGNGHRHVYLPSTGDGALIPDQSPEGAGATTPQPQG